jgi:hypothetical protein
MYDPTDRIVSLRRTLEQAHHCVAEALSVVETGEDPRCALDDVRAAVGLLGGKVSDDLAALVLAQKRNIMADERNVDVSDVRRG